jgi:hypothetical protein
MKIILRPGPRGVIGELDGRPLAYVGGRLKVAGEPVERQAIAGALVDAVDEAATRVFGSVWVKKLGLVAGLGLRRCQRDRIAQFGLPAPTLEMLGRAAAHKHARALGDIMLAIARLQESQPSDYDVIGEAQHALHLATELATTARLSRRGRKAMVAGQAASADVIRPTHTGLG